MQTTFGDIHKLTIDWRFEKRRGVRRPAQKHGARIRFLLSGWVMAPGLRKIVFLLLTANLLFGLSIIAILPPFEGFDETAHFSRLKSQAFSPQADRSSLYIAADVFEYYRRAPMPYGWINYAPLHLNDSLGGYTTYHDFFTQPARVTDYSWSYWQLPLPAGFSPSPQTNWEYQHPGFYYEVTGVVMKLLAGHVSLITAMLILRSFSFLLAFIGFCIGLQATWNHLAASGTPDADTITALGLLYPFLMPMFFWEFGRLGNDSMCLFLFGIIWSLLLWHLREPRSDAWLYLGLCIGLSWLTKAIMIPSSLGIATFLALHHFFIVRKNGRHAKDWWHPPLKMIGLLLLIGAPLYLLSYFSSGHFGAEEFSQFMKDGHPWLDLRQAISAKGYLLDPRQILHSAFGTAVSWSLVFIDIPILFYSLLCDFTIAVLLVYLVSLRWRSGAIFRLPLWTLGPVLLGLLVHLVVVLLLAYDKAYDGATPGYYLHIFAPAFALIYGVSLKWLLNRKWLEGLTVFFIASIALLNFLYAWAYAILFSGCAIPVRTKVSGQDMLVLPFMDVLHCTAHFPSVIAPLEVLAWPKLALCCFVPAFVLLASAAIRILIMHSRRLPSRSF